MVVSVVAAMTQEEEEEDLEAQQMALDTMSSMSAKLAQIVKVCSAEPASGGCVFGVVEMAVCVEMVLNMIAVAKPEHAAEVLLSLVRLLGIAAERARQERGVIDMDSLYDCVNRGWRAVVELCQEGEWGGDGLSAEFCGWAIFLASQIVQLNRTAVNADVGWLHWLLVVLDKVGDAV